MDTVETSSQPQGEQATSPGGSRAGRNLPVATITGVALGAVLVGALLWRKEAFLVVAVVAICVGVWEFSRALAHAGIAVPLTPALVGTLAMLGGAYYGGPQALAVTFGLSAVAMLLWRAADGGPGAARDLAGGLFVLAYPSFLLGFAVLLLVPDDGGGRMFTYLLVTVCSDVGGYAVGVLLGRHPLAPSISPKKSWEGLGGSLLGCVLGGVAAIVLVMHGSWWIGVVLGVAVALAATTGDLMESMIKRDLGIKDMSHVLPGHGGLMDRLDSLVMTAPIVWAVLVLLLPPR